MKNTFHILKFFTFTAILSGVENSEILRQRYTPGRQEDKSTQAKIKITYTRFILKKDTILNISPYQSFKTSKSLACYEKCLDSNGRCLSLNIKVSGVNEFECQLLDTDSFLDFTSLVEQVGTQHVIIKVSFRLE